MYALLIDFPARLPYIPLICRATRVFEDNEETLSGIMVDLSDFEMFG